MRAAAVEYLKESRKRICLYLGFSGTFFVVFELYGVPKAAICYAFLLAGFWLLMYGLTGFFRYVRHHGELLEAESRMESGLDFLPVPIGIIEEDYQRILRELYDRSVELESESRIARREMTDYYGMWVHQVKTPIAALRVLIQAYESAEDENVRRLVRDMKLELFKIEQYVEMVLTYLRMESMSSDLTFEVCSLDDLICQAVRKYSQMFILQKIKLKYEPVNQKVLTDGKWLVFVLEQLLSNALKYTAVNEGRSGGEEACISIYAQKECLVIEDNGIGIYPEDLPRVFEKGFTGYNGRSDKKSTGIGLYLCKSVMDKLKHGIRMESQPGKGTKVLLGLSRDSLWVE